MAKRKNSDDSERKIKNLRQRMAKNKKEMRKNLSNASPERLDDVSLKLRLLDCLEDILEFIYRPTCY